MLICPAAVTGGGWSLIAHVEVGTTPALIGSATNAYPSAAIDTTNADLLVLCSGAWYASGTPSDSKSNTWLTGISPGLDGNDPTIFYCRPPSAKTGTGHTFSLSGGTINAMQVLAFSGSAVSPADQSGVLQADQSPALTAFSPSITPSVNNCLVVTNGCGASVANTNFLTIGSGFTITGSTGFSGSWTASAAAYRFQTTAAAVSPVWTLQVAGPVGVAIISFKGA